MFEPCGSKYILLYLTEKCYKQRVGRLKQRVGCKKGFGGKETRWWLKKRTVVKQNGWGVKRMVVSREVRRRDGRLKTRVGWFNKNV